MGSQSNISITTLHKEVHKALRMWHKDSSKDCPINHLYLFRQSQREGYSSRRAMIQVIFKGLKVLQAERPGYAELLEIRFRRGMSVAKAANKYSISEQTVLQRQRKAIKCLAEKLQGLEEKAIADYHIALEKRLGPRTSPYLTGLEEHLEYLQKELFSSDSSWLLSISGIGGIGKTTLAAALVRQLIGEGPFEDFGWVTAQQRAFNLGGYFRAINKPALTTDALVEALVKQLLDLRPGQLSATQALDALYGRLKSYPHLIVIDNLETVQDIESLLPTLSRLANPSKFLLTSRKRLVTEPDVHNFLIPPLSETNALKLIREEARRRNLSQLKEKEDKELRPIYEAVGGNPLALRLIVGQAHFHHLSMILSDLQAARGESIENLYTYIYRRAWDNLDDVTRRLFLAMPLVTERGGILSHMAHVSELEPSALRKSLRLLITLNLVNVSHESNGSRYTIHNLTRTFLQEQVAKWQ